MRALGTAGPGCSTGTARCCGWLADAGRTAAICCAPGDGDGALRSACAASPPEYDCRAGRATVGGAAGGVSGRPGAGGGLYVKEPVWLRRLSFHVKLPPLFPRTWAIVLRMSSKALPPPGGAPPRKLPARSASMAAGGGPPNTDTSLFCRDKVGECVTDLVFGRRMRYWVARGLRFAIAASSSRFISRVRVVRLLR